MSWIVALPVLFVVEPVVAIVGGVASGVRFVWTVAKLLYKGFRAAADQAP